MITTNQNIHNELAVLKMKKVKHFLAGTIFALLGTIFLYLDLTRAVDHMNHDPTGHDISLLGVGEMTWMWFTMALVHFFLNDR